MRPLLAVDICNTIADVNSEILRVLGLPGRPSTYGLKDVGVENEEAFFRNHPEIFAEARPIPDSREVLWSLAPHWKLVYVTTRPWWARDLTIRWLDRWNFPPGPVRFTVWKLPDVREIGAAAAIEDAPDTIQELRSVCYVVPIGQPYNGYQTTWRDVPLLLAADSIKKVPAEFCPFPFCGCPAVRMEIRDLWVWMYCERGHAWKKGWGRPVQGGNNT